MSSGDGSWTGGVEIKPKYLPPWVRKLRWLAPIGAAIGTASMDPEQWFRNFIQSVIVEWVVGGVLDVWSFVLGWIIFAYERTASILTDALPFVGQPFRIVGDVIVGTYGLLFDSIQAVVESLGVAAPVAAALTTAILVLIHGAVLVALFRVIPGSDLVEALPEGFR